MCWAVTYGDMFLLALSALSAAAAPEPPVQLPVQLPVQALAQALAAPQITHLSQLPGMFSGNHVTSPDLAGESWPGSCRLRSQRYVSDGLCSSTRPLAEVVCADTCVMTAWTPGGARPLPWRCADGGWRRRRVRLLCRDGSTRTFRVRLVQSCRCVPRGPREHQPGLERAGLERAGLERPGLGRPGPGQPRRRQRQGQAQGLGMLHSLHADTES